MNNPQLSVIIPVYNEEAGLHALFERLYPALDKLATNYEIIFINDGSRDHSAAMLREQFQQRPDVTRVLLFNGNFGQHMAIMAGFEHSRGQRIVTLDADLQTHRRKSALCSKKWIRVLTTWVLSAAAAPMSGGGTPHRAR